jgi:hypothetical protein
MRTKQLVITVAGVLLLAAGQAFGQSDGYYVADDGGPPPLKGSELKVVGDNGYGDGWDSPQYSECYDGMGYDIGMGGDVGCDADICWDGCEVPCAAPKWNIYGEFLYLRPRNGEVPYGVVMDGPTTSPPDVPIQVSPLGIVDPDYEPAFRIGFERAIGPCTTVGASYTNFDSRDTDSLSTSEEYVVRSMVAHPSTLTASSDGLNANASYGIDFELADLEFRSLIGSDDCHTLNYLVGIRYSHLAQGFRSQFAVNGEETVLTDIRFDGGGFRVGLEGERYLGCTRFMVYGRGMASFVAGDFRARYAQGTAYDASVVDTAWRGGRVVPILDLELGMGWSSWSGRWRLQAGYLFSAWYNTVKTDEIIQAVQTNNFADLGDTLTFDGFSIRGEYRF